MTADLVIVGAGIHGAVAALEASRRGLDIVILERGDLGGATSWSSLRILHGGFRYLQTLDLVRFRDSVRSRAWYLAEFDQLIEPLECLMPIYGNGLRRPALLRPALALDGLLRRRWSSRHELERIPAGRVLDSSEVRTRFPGVRADGLKGGLVWYDAFLPAPQRVVIELLRRAEAHGARIFNYAEATGVEANEGGAVVTVAARGDGPGSVSCRAVLNCAGPWAPQLDGSPTARRDVSLAFNLVLARPLPSTTTVAVEPPGGGRTYFLHPRGDTTLAGTYHATAESADSSPTDRQLDELLEDIRSSVPGYDVDRADVLRVLAGTLPAAEGSSGEPSSRDVWAAPAGSPPVFTLMGSKYTTAPVAAARAIDAVASRCFPSMPADADTRVEPEIRTVPDWVSFVEWTARDPQRAESLVRAIVREEYVTSLEDLLLRRTDWGLVPSDYDTAERLLADLCPDLLDAAGQGGSPPM